VKSRPFLVRSLITRASAKFRVKNGLEQAPLFRVGTRKKEHCLKSVFDNINKKTP
jgi:hypothetical protein